MAVVLATSGSTGLPKGAELTAGALIASARASLRRLGAAPGARWWCCLPTHHIAGLGVLVRSLVTGSVPLVSDQVDAEAVARAVTSFGCTHVSLVPTQLRRLLDAGASLASFEAILLGGASIPATLLADATAAGARVVTTYGMTETCGGCVYDGWPLDGVRVGDDVGGLIAIGGEVLFSRYRLAPELTEASLRDGEFVTSDLGGLGPAGRLVLRGRADDVINTGGEKVVPGLVEDALRGLDAVREAAVVGVPDADWGERVTAVLVPADPAAGSVAGSAAGSVAGSAALPALAEMRSALRDQLPRYALPQGVVWVTELPMLASGKPDRLKLRSLAAQADREAP